MNPDDTTSSVATPVAAPDAVPAQGADRAPADHQPAAAAPQAVSVEASSASSVVVPAQAPRVSSLMAHAIKIAALAAENKRAAELADRITARHLDMFRYAEANSGAIGDDLSVTFEAVGGAPVLEIPDSLRRCKIELQVICKEAGEKNITVNGARVFTGMMNALSSYYIGIGNAKAHGGKIRVGGTADFVKIVMTV